MTALVRAGEPVTYKQLAAPPPENNRPQLRSPPPNLLGQLMAAKAAALEISPEPAEKPLNAEE